MVDQRALDKATAALAGYIRRNPPMQFHNKHTGKVDAIISDLHARACIEAYEAARWRPIEEGKVENGRVMVAWGGMEDEGAIQICWLDPVIQTRRWLNGYESILESDFPSAMFRTIDPPKQDAISRATSTPPEAEASS